MMRRTTHKEWEYKWDENPREWNSSEVFFPKEIDNYDKDMLFFADTQIVFEYKGKFLKSRW